MPTTSGTTTTYAYGGQINSSKVLTTGWYDITTLGAASGNTNLDIAAKGTGRASASRASWARTVGWPTC